MTWILIGVLLAGVLALALPERTARRARVDEADAAFLERARVWAREVLDDLNRSRTDFTFVTRDVRNAWHTARPTGSLSARALQNLTTEESDAVALLETDLAKVVAEHNAGVTRRALIERRPFLETIESKPLTMEQAVAVVTMDNRVQVVAAAGSGKTSVMVARAGWAIEYAGVRPDEVLMLAFNRAAAQELQERVDQRLGAAGIDPTGVRASTFHAFGLEVIGQAAGRKPRLASWLDSGQDVEAVSRIVDELHESDPTFRHRWDLYRLLFARVTDEDEASPDGYDRETRATGFTTMKGEVVKSQGERLLADWLFLNGVDYRYEHPYVHDVADAQHSQYRPDFFYPEVDVWHEHWALDANGKPPSAFDGYAASMAWKRATHRAHGTTLVETTWAEILDASGFAPLEEELTGHGLTLDWDPDRVAAAGEPVRHEDLARLVRTFLAHVKASGFTPEEVDAQWRRAGSSYRSRLFLDLYWPIHQAWQQRLHADDAIDFEDMLNEAAGHVEAGFDPGFRMVLVDEFQDASPARARLVRALVAKPHRHLMTVGDDWQAINRFAGADISVMTDFEQWFGEGRTLALETTFRCTQTVADTAAEFVQQNPRQIRKQVRAARKDPGEPVSLVRLAAEDEIPAAVSAWLRELSAQVESATVDVLGRYGFERDLVPRDVPSNLTVTFRTAHGSKGLEADHVLVPRMVTGRFGFPSTIADDPVLDLVMSSADSFPHGEERRLFYVALTRAKQTVTLMTVRGQESPFVTELVQAGRVQDSPLSTVEEVVACPTCGQGSLVPRTGPYGRFLGCSTFPRCRHTQKLAVPGPAPV